MHIAICLPALDNMLEATNNVYCSIMCQVNIFTLSFCLSCSWHSFFGRSLLDTRPLMTLLLSSRDNKVIDGDRS